jgi:hypothetical protein
MPTPHREPEVHRQEPPPDKGEARSNIFSMSILVGAVGLALADSLRGGLSGLQGFLLAFAIAFLALCALVLLSARSSSHSSPDNRGHAYEIGECPNCHQVIRAKVDVSINDARSIQGNSNA